MKRMIIFITALGSIVMTAILFGVPVLAALSIVYGWHPFAKMMLWLATAAEFAVVSVGFIILKDEEGD